ncbi:MAG: EVE domain-containing protein [Bryobacteraceae bacterium]|jgi:predicted RNA-binding protein with PUA-like domain|nr:EVE domain-containing protein [Bryobacteraceae bacterium]
MATKYFLAKTDPETYSLADLEREGRTVWDGVKNPQALKAIRQMKPGDKVFIYHSGGESAIVGLAEVVSEPRPDPKNPKLTVADFRFLTKLDPPTTLAEVKGAGRFDDWALVRQPRLSTMEVPPEFVTWMRRRYPDARL